MVLGTRALARIHTTHAARVARPTWLSPKDAGRESGPTLPPAARDSNGHELRSSLGRSLSWKEAGLGVRWGHTQSSGPSGTLLSCVPCDLSRIPLKEAPELGETARRPAQSVLGVATQSAGHLRGLLACDPRGSYIRTMRQREF